MSETPSPGDERRGDPDPRARQAESPTEAMGAPLDDETGVPGAEPPPSGAAYPGPPPAPWPPQPPAGRGRLRGLAARARGSRVALAVAGLVVAVVLVGGGVAIGHVAGDEGGGRDGRGGVAANRDREGDGGNGKGDRGRTDHGGRERGAGDNRADGDGNRGGNATGSTRQVLGMISSLSSTSITLRTSGGTPSYPITAGTPVTRGGSDAAVSNLKVGDAVVVRVQTVSVGAAPVVVSISAS